MLGATAQKTIDEKSNSLIELATGIWETPEIGYQEKTACKLTAEFLEKEGFQVETGYAGVPTAIRAVWGEGKPAIGLLGEYDALSNMSQKVATTKEFVVEDGPGHGCGHNLLGVAHVGAALALKQEMQEKNLKGTVVFFGCPAEEMLTGKTFMARNGAFRDLDFAFAWHPGGRNGINVGTLTALNSAKFHFKGITAHAGGDPHNGRSALDAAELMNVGAQFLREHVTDDVRIHYAFTDVHGAPNVVPDKASVWYYVRALSREAVEDTYERLVKIAKGAAMMTETDVEIEFMGGCYNTLPNMVITEVLQKTMEEITPPQWSAEEIKFAEELNKVSANYEKLVASGALKQGEHLHSYVDPIICQNVYGSTDVGDVQHIVPTCFFCTACNNLGAAYHSWQITSCSNHSIGHKGMLYGAKAMAVTGLRFIEDSALLQKAKDEFAKVMNGRSYKCPIPAEVPVPQPLP